MIRNFTLTNALGASFSLMNAQQGAFFEPQGLGYDDVTQYEQVGEFFAPLTQRYGQQVVTGTMVFGSQPYEHYLAFTKFCQHAPLSLVYETDAGTFQIPCRLTKIEKGDTDGWTYLNCKVEFTALARMYKTVVANNTGTAGGGKIYSEKELPDITGSIITIDNAEAGEVLNITADINPVQDLHGYDAPWVGGAGEQLIPYPYSFTGNTTINGITFNVIGEGNITVSGTATANAQIDLCTTVYATMLKLEAGKTYTASINQSVCELVLAIYTAQGQLAFERITDTFTSISLPNDGLDYRARVLLRVRSGVEIASQISVAMKVQEGSTATAWSPYENICPISGHIEVDVVVSPTTNASDGTTYTTALPETVYGGTLDLVSGELTVSYANINPTSIYDVYYHSGSGLYYVLVTNNLDAKSDNSGFLASNMFADKSAIAIGNCYITSYGDYLIAVLPNQTITTKADADTWFSSNNVQFVYELATPTTYQLTPQQIQTVLGQNNVWANSGDITITGRKTYGYKYNYTYGDFVADTVTIDSDSTTSSPCRITIFGECTQPTWRHYLDGNSVATGYYNGTIPSGHKLVIDTTSSPYSIEEQDIAGNLIADRYELCDFSTERFFLLEYGHNTISVSHTDPDSIRLMVEGYIFYETV